ncbi:MAG TPA: histidine kinase [Pyrinomonadaceae bacterium]|nr:histidine kinase [Pyrinomonadaceae bacterium]
MKSSLSFSSSDAMALPSNVSASKTRRLKWAIIVGFWTFFGLLNGTQLYLGLRMEGMRLPLWRVFATDLFGWWPWILATPIVLAMGRRFPLERGTWWRVLPVHILACALIAAAHFAFFTYANGLFSPFGPPRTPHSFWESFLGRATSQFHIDLLIYAATLGVSYAVSYYLRFREREFRASQLETQLAQAQLQTLKMQLQPHFLFNTLNGIAGLVRDSRNKAAVNMIAGLSDLLRYTLENAGKQEVPLKEELEFLELYLDIQQMRFSDRLKIEMEIQPETLNAAVPNLILQPLVENAIRHGISRRAAAGIVGVRAERDDGFLQIKIYDDGPGLRPEDGATEGVGLSNTRARLAQLYGERQKFSLTERAGGGVEALLIIPFLRAAED